MAATFTEWGYLQRAAPPGVPSLLSRHIDLDYTHQICKQAFPDGKVASEPLLSTQPTCAQS